MSLVEWLSLAQVVVAIAGFSFAVWQLSRTRSAVERTEARLKINELLYELPQLHRLEQDLDDAARQGGVDASIRTLNDWRRQAGIVLAFLKSQDGHQADDELIQEIGNSIALAGQAKNALVGGKTNPLAVTTGCRMSIEKVCRDLPQVATQLRSKIGGEEARANT